MPGSEERKRRASVRLLQNTPDDSREDSIQATKKAAIHLDDTGSEAQ